MKAQALINEHENCMRKLTTFIPENTVTVKVNHTLY